MLNPPEGSEGWDFLFDVPSGSFVRAEGALIEGRTHYFLEIAFGGRAPFVEEIPATQIDPEVLMIPVKRCPSE